MALPHLIEIVPLGMPVHAEITVPGSKSITNRALILGALGDGETTLRGALWSEDTRVMVNCLQELGYILNVAPDANEIGNRTLTIYGKGALVPRGGTEEQPMELFVGNAGTAARFLTALVCLGRGAYRLYGTPRMHERPQAALFEALRELGYRIASPNNKLPAVIHGTGPHSGKCVVSIEQSSQFASALMLCAGQGGWQIQVVGENMEESPYVRMTSELLKVFPGSGGRFQIEPDASSGSYFWAVSALQLLWERQPAGSQPLAMDVFKPPVTVAMWPKSDWQPDTAFPRFLRLPLSISRRADLGDSIMTAIVMAPFVSKPVQFTDLGRLRVQECERVVALRTELTKCGAKAVEEGDTLTVYPSELHGAGIETYNDHRMAMCFAILGLKVPGIKIKNPSCVKKTFPNFFQKLAATPPGGLGAEILSGTTGRALSGEDLFAE
jgi:3-phosphoshikimate 1-carboxyvinyltransferase